MFELEHPVVQRYSRESFLGVNVHIYYYKIVTSYYHNISNNDNIIEVIQT